MLLDYLRRWRSSALIQRFGYFLDLHGVEAIGEIRYALLDLVLPQSNIHLGSRRKWGTSGKLVRLWNVVENVPRDTLISEEDKSRQRVVFSKRTSRTGIKVQDSGDSNFP